LRFDEQIKNTENYQGNAVINYCQKHTKYTRTIEHKHFEKVDSDKTVVTYEYPEEYKKGSTPYYPINDAINTEIYKKYLEKTKSLTNHIFGGRLSEYKYMDMHVVIESAMNKFKL
jgi:UDP-galactopyranose mutase